jgi:hypothetical protein
MPPATLDKRFTLRLATMVDARLIGWQCFAPWADDLISSLESPPPWLLDLSTTKYQPDAVRLLRQQACSPPFEEFDPEEESDEFLASLFLRYRHGEISWATFLNEGGRHLDAVNGRRPCESLYELLTELEHQEYSTNVEHAQCASVERDLKDALARIEPLYLTLVECFRRSVKSTPT